MRRSNALVKKMNLPKRIVLTGRVTKSVRNSIFTNLKSKKDFDSIINASALITCKHSPFECKVKTDYLDLERTLLHLKRNTNSMIGEHLVQFPDHCMNEALRDVRQFKSKHECSLVGWTGLRINKSVEQWPWRSFYWIVWLVEGPRSQSFSKNLIKSPVVLLMVIKSVTSKFINLLWTISSQFWCWWMTEWIGKEREIRVILVEHFSGSEHFPGRNYLSYYVSSTNESNRMRNWTESKVLFFLIHSQKEAYRPLATLSVN